MTSRQKFFDFFVSHFCFFFNFFRSFREISSNKFDFAHRSGALARLGSRELRAVRIATPYMAWRTPKRPKTDLAKIQFFGSRKTLFR